MNEKYIVWYPSVYHNVSLIEFDICFMQFDKRFVLPMKVLLALKLKVFVSF